MRNVFIAVVLVGATLTACSQYFNDYPTRTGTPDATTGEAGHGSPDAAIGDTSRDCHRLDGRHRHHCDHPPDGGIIDGGTGGSPDAGTGGFPDGGTGGSPDAGTGGFPDGGTGGSPDAGTGGFPDGGTGGSPDAGTGGFPDAGASPDAYR